MERLLTRDFVVLTTAHFLQALGYSSMLLLPLYLQLLGATRAEIGLLMATAAMSGLVLRPAIGWALDTVGRKPTLLAGTVMLSGGMAMLALVDRLGPLLYLHRVVVGIGLGTLFTGYFTWAADLVPQSRRTEGLAIFGVSGLLPLLVNPASEVIGIAPRDLRWFLPAVSGLVALSLLALFALREQPRRPDAPAFRAREAIAALGQRSLWPVWVATCALGGLVAVFMAFATVAAERRGIERPASLWLTYALGAAAVRLFGGKLPDRVGPERMVAPALAFYLAGALVLAAAQSLAATLACGLLAGIGHGYCFPVLTSQLVTRVPQSFRGSALATFTALWGGCELIASPAFGAVADCWGDAVMFQLAAATGLAALFLWWLLEQRFGRLAART